MGGFIKALLASPKIKKIFTFKENATPDILFCLYH